MASTEFCFAQKDCYTCSHGRKCFKRLAAYEGIGLEPDEIKNFLKKWCDIAECGGFSRVPNDPLTLEELREMDGEPVWCVSNAHDIARINCWTIISVDLERCAGNAVWLNFEDYGTWLGRGDQ